MCGQTTLFLTEKAARIAANKAAAKQAAVVTDAYTAVDGARTGTAKRTKNLTKDARDAKKKVLEVVQGVLGPLKRVAEDLENADLLTSATLTKEQLRKMTPKELIGVVTGILTMTTAPAVDAALSDRGLTQTALQPIRDAVQAFADAQPKPRKTIHERVRAGEKLTSLVDALMTEVRTLDDEMKAFIVLDPELYGDYLQVRKIINTGGGGVKPEDGATDGQ